jgi:long-subunit fatty acid transport protein
MRILISIMLVITFANASFSQAKYYFKDPELLNSRVYDTRAHSLGKCEILGTTGSNAIFSNPANIASFETTQIQVGGIIKMGNFDDSLWDTNQYASSEISQVYKPQYSLAQFSIVRPFGKIYKNILMSAGIGLNEQIDFIEETVYEREYSDGRTSEEKNTIISGGIYFLTPSVAFQFDNNLKVGFTYNKSIIGGKNSSVDENDGEILDPSHNYEQDMDASFFTFGLTYPLFEKFTVGMMYKSAMEVECEKYEAIPGTYTYWPDYDLIYPDYTVRVPATFGFAGEYRISTIFTLYSEYQTRNWSSAKIDGEKIEAFDDGRSIRLGVDAAINNTSLRVGYFNDSMTLTDINIKIDEYDNNKKPLNENGVTYGLGYSRGRYLIEIGGEVNWITQEVEKSFFLSDYISSNENRKIMHVFSASMTYYL